MFTLDLSPTYRMPVTLQVRGADGQFQADTFQADFRRMGPEEFDAYRETIQAQSLTDRDISQHVLCGWSDLQDAAGAPVPFDAAHVAALLGGVQGAAVAIARIWMESVMEEVRKNFSPPADTGPAAANKTTAPAPTTP